MDDPTILRWYIAVAEELNFGRAAAALGISRKRLSDAVIELRDQVGEPLFVPGDGPTELTEAGHAQLIRARGVVAADDARLAEQQEKVAGLIVGFVPGVTVTKWTRIWHERFPSIPLETVVIDEVDQVTALHDGRVDACFVRFPIDGTDLNAVPLYSEVAVVVVQKDHPISLFDDVTLADLDDESVQDLPDRGEAVPVALEMVAAGVGPVILPHSLARLHARKDLVSKPVVDADSTRVAFAWRAVDVVEGTTKLVDEFLGVVRGRSENSSRGSAQQPVQKKTAAKNNKKTPDARAARTGGRKRR